MTVIAVFGSGSVKPGTPQYQAACQLGRGLGKAGFVVMTGGYAGTMEAVSRGASEADAHVIGVTYGKKNHWNDPVNEWVKKEIRFETYPQRLQHLVENADAYVVLPGGNGTQEEFETLHELTAKEKIPQRTVVFLGEFWREAVNTLTANDDDSQPRVQIVFATNPIEAVAALQEALSD